MTHKLVDNIDDELWRKFVGYCKIKNHTVGAMVNKIIKEKLDEEGIK